MFKVEEIQVVRTKGSGVRGAVNGFLDKGRSEGLKIWVQRVGFVKFLDDFVG